MINTKFEAYKLRRELKRVGIDFEFKRAVLNEFKEPTNENSSIVTLTGLYHEQSTSVSVTTGETTQTRTKKTPMILCLHEDTKLIKLGDFIEMNSKKMKVTGIVNIQEWNIISDISLEVVDDVFHN